MMGIMIFADKTEVPCVHFSDIHEKIAFMMNFMLHGKLKESRAGYFSAERGSQVNFAVQLLFSQL